MTSPADSRDEYRRRLQHRQTTVIGGILAVMAILTIVCLAIWTGMVPAPYEPGFATAAPTATVEPQVCPPTDAKTVELSSVKANVYNGTDTTGLAGGVAGVLSDADVQVTATADWPKGSYDGDVLITTSQTGLVNAYTLAQLFTGTVRVQLDSSVDAGDATVSVVLGGSYKQGILAEDEIAKLKAGTAIKPPVGCVAATASATAK
ncbi:LytR C-terminal domain-containing protein [Actinomyces radicidentis]|uniref:LytR C-terminal domain-containing protein n=1 Tax=Actinomyces radicidentis TaxID=111015 RepID=UPI0026E011D2|nr:LytR C-terminal domain-containing protein [Actinomyces radicidentis]